MSKAKTMKTVVPIIAGFALSLLLLWLLIRFIPFDLGEIVDFLKNADLFFGALIVCCSVMHFVLSSIKWRLVTRALTGGKEPNVSYLGYQGMIGLFAQFLPLQVCSLLVRSLSMRVHAKIPVTKGASSTVYDQMFDFMVPITCVLFALLAILKVLSPKFAFCLAVAAVILLGVLIGVYGGRVLESMVRLLTRMPGIGTIVRKRISLDKSPALTSLLDRRLALKLFILSVIRYGNMVLRAYFIVRTMGLDIGFLPLVHTMCIVMASVVISFVPAGLGVTEWGWVGVLTGFGVPFEVASQFAILRRIAVFISVIAGSVIVAPDFLLKRRK